MKIEFAKIEDLKSIQRLNLMLFQKEKKDYDKYLNLKWTRGKKGSDYFKKSIFDNNSCALVARDENKIVGYLVGWISKELNPCRNIGKHAELENMLVLPEYRNEEVGSKLVKKFLSWAKGKKVKSVEVCVYFENLRAAEFYKRHGFGDTHRILEVNF